MSRTVYLDAGRLSNRMQAHSYLASMLSLPEYYGKNLDALYDCLCDLTDCRIVLLHEKKAPLDGTYGARIIQVIQESARRNPGLVFKKSDE